MTEKIFLYQNTVMKMKIKFFFVVFFNFLKLNAATKYTFNF
jgi:hypothetical protein